MSQVIMSLKPEYGELVFSGSKTVELRNRIARIEPGTTIWIYFTKPSEQDSWGSRCEISCLR